MTQNRLAIALLGLALGAAFGATAQQKPSYTVGNARELVQRLGSNRTIVLKKGDYRLWTAYDVKNDAVSWEEAEDGKELMLSGFSNLTIRGAEGSRIVTNSATAYILGIYEGSSIELSNLSFIRELETEAEIEAGSLYIEGGKGIVLDRLGFEGPTGYPLELWDCEGVELKKPRIEGGSYGALYAGSTWELRVTGGSVSGNSGYPLLYLEGSDAVSFTDTRFEGNSGGNFIEVYSEEGYLEELGFRDCSFADNDFEYFSGTQLLPYTEGCRFEGNSFDEDWADYSIAPVVEEYYGDEEGPAYYIHEGSSLAWTYPLEWELQEDEGGVRVALFSPYEEALALFTQVYEIPANLSPGRQSAKIFADGLSALSTLLKNEADFELALQEEGQPTEERGFLEQAYIGGAHRSDGADAQVRLSLVIMDGRVYAFLGLASEDYSFEPGAELEGILSSLELAPGE